MELSLNALVDHLDDLFFERATRAWRIAAGVERDIPAIAELPELARLDGWQVVSELLASPRVDEAKRARLILLRRHLARAYVDAQTLTETAKVEHFLSGHGFFASARTWTPHEATREIPRLVSREGRGALATELSLQLSANDSLPARRLDATLEAISRLKLDPSGFVEELHGRPLGARLETAQKMLDETADAHRDLLGYALKKLDPMLTPRVGAQHDADRAALAPWLFESFRKEDLTHALSRCLGDLGLSPNADGRLTIDSEPRAGRDPSQRCIELRVPDQVRLLLTPDYGFETYAGWLSQWGIALHRAHVGRTLPFVERRLGDRAIIDGVGLLFETFLLDEGWLKRYLRLTASQAKEAARAFGFRQLHQLRRAAGLATFSAHAVNRGSTAGLMDEYVPRLSAALGVEVPRGHTLFEVDAFGEHALRLDGFSLEQSMRRNLQERFNEDFWRNPATGRWLVDLANRGQREDSAALVKALDMPELSLSEAARHRVGVMGA